MSHGGVKQQQHNKHNVYYKSSLLYIKSYKYSQIGLTVLHVNRLRQSWRWRWISTRWGQTHALSPPSLILWIYQICLHACFHFDIHNHMAPVVHNTFSTLQCSIWLWLPPASSSCHCQWGMRIITLQQPPSLPRRYCMGQNLMALILLPNRAIMMMGVWMASTDDINNFHHLHGYYF